ncbi:helix-turn-helix domain-containing protein [Paenibacillus glycanilyticus]|uniref:helix-turn-helix domain-containing protein n=1 Tax=Paenibacillus glycanilyticus TaxID=126569 RepID=UPI003EC03BAE
MTVEWTPERLLNENYLDASSPFRIYEHSITNKIETHWHEFFEIAFVLSGSGVHTLNGVSRRLERGLLFLLTPADFHEIVPDPGETIRLYDLIFLESFIKYDLLELIYANSPYSYPFEPKEADQLEELCRRIWDETKNADIGHSILIQGALERLLIDLARACRKSTPGVREGSSAPHLLHPSLRRGLVYMHHHFREPLTLAKVANYAGLSATYFSECFSKQVGLSYQNYLQQLRLKFAKSLLASTDLTITEVCFAAGFNTVPHFERVFKQTYHQTPSGYRKTQA